MSDSDYIFSAHAILLKIMLNDQINTVISNVRSDSLPAGMLRKILRILTDSLLSVIRHIALYILLEEPHPIQRDLTKYLPGITSILLAETKHLP